MVLGTLLFIIPLTMMGFGRLFLNSPPKKINGNYGFRTAMSILNMDTWKFAHYHCGKLWTKVGTVTLLCSVVAYIAVMVMPQEVMYTFIVVVLGLQLIALIAPTFVIEKKLKDNFDKFGRRLAK